MTVAKFGLLMSFSLVNKLSEEIHTHNHEVETEIVLSCSSTS